jgi:hypothetical protein
MAQPKKTWELEVSDLCNTWCYGTKRFRPGVYTTEDPALAKAAGRAHGVHVRELHEEEAGETVIYPDAPGEVGPLEVKDLREPRPESQTCEKCGKAYKHQHKCLSTDLAATEED